jgi:cob(I)alamin adenosyltransferase
LHVARTVCRRAERAVASLLEDDPSLSIEVVPYINRLSDLLFTLARAVNHRAGRSETEWTPMRRVDRTDTSPTPADIEDS